jgi:hypothetical protein
LLIDNNTNTTIISSFVYIVKFWTSTDWLIEILLSGICDILFEVGHNPSGGRMGPSPNPQHQHVPPPEPDKLMTYEQAMIYAHPALKDACM